MTISSKGSLFHKKDKKHHDRIARINQRYDKKIKELREYFSNYKRILAHKNFKDFLQIHNKRMLDYQIESRKNHRKIESQFLKIYQEKLDLENELSQLEVEVNNRADTQFANIEKVVQKIIKNSDYDFSRLNLSVVQLQSIYFSIDQIQSNLDFFDETFQVLKNGLLKKISSENSKSKQFISISEETFDFCRELSATMDKFECVSKIMEKVCEFKSSLVI